MLLLFVGGIGVLLWVCMELGFGGIVVVFGVGVFVNVVFIGGNLVNLWKYLFVVFVIIIVFGFMLMI